MVSPSDNYEYYLNKAENNIEKWVEIPKYKNFYKISNKGRIKSLDRTITRKDGRQCFLKGIILTSNVNPKISYPYYTLCDKKGIKKKFMVHVLVLEIFKGKRPKGQEARHLDGNKLNACLSNLIWGTPVENAADREIHGTHVRGTKHVHCTLTDKQVNQIKNHKNWKIGDLQYYADKFGVAKSTICRIKKGRRHNPVPRSNVGH